MILNFCRFLWSTKNFSRMPKKCEIVTQGYNFNGMVNHREMSINFLNYRKWILWWKTSVSLCKKVQKLSSQWLTLRDFFLAYNSYEQKNKNVMLTKTLSFEWTHTRVSTTEFKPRTILNGIINSALWRNCSIAFTLLKMATHFSINRTEHMQTLAQVLHLNNIYNFKAILRHVIIEIAHTMFVGFRSS